MAQKSISRAVALLHSFGYEEARIAFNDAAKTDRACAMGHWGVARTWYHPIWAPPSPDEMRQGAAALDRALAANAKTARERDYISSLAVFYTDWQRVDHTTRAKNYERAFGGRTHPDHLERPQCGLEGPHHVTPEEIAATFADLLGRPVRTEAVARKMERSGSLAAVIPFFVTASIRSAGPSAHAACPTRPAAFLSNAARFPPSSRRVASTCPKKCMNEATRPVQPVWWLAPIPAPLSPWKYS